MTRSDLWCVPSIEWQACRLEQTPRRGSSTSGNYTRCGRAKWPMSLGGCGRLGPGFGQPRPACLARVKPRALEARLAVLRLRLWPSPSSGNMARPSNTGDPMHSNAIGANHPIHILALQHLVRPSEPCRCSRLSSIIDDLLLPTLAAALLPSNNIHRRCHSRSVWPPTFAFCRQPEAACR